MGDCEQCAADQSARLRLSAVVATPSECIIASAAQRTEVLHQAERLDAVRPSRQPSPDGLVRRYGGVIHVQEADDGRALGGDVVLQTDRGL